MAIAMKEETVTSGAETSAEAEQQTGANGEDKKPEPVQFYKNLVKQAQELAQADDWRKAEKELDALSHQWSDGPDGTGEEQEEKVKDLFYKFTKATESFEDKKELKIEEKRQQIQKKLIQKKQVLKELKNIVDNEQWSARGKVQKLQKRWDSGTSLPDDINNELQSEFKELIKEFKSHKADRIIEKRQKQEDNLMLKMAVLDKMEKTVNDINKETTGWKKIDDQFENLTRQWKKIGLVPREKADEAWNRYKNAQDAYYDAKYKFDKKHRKQVDKFTAKKEKLCCQAEALIDQDLLKAARKINGLHRRWKKTGNLPQRKEDKLWDRFKAAIDEFNQKKADNSEELEKREEANYKKKEKLIEAANEVKETSDWKKGHQQMQSLMSRWKKSGPVSRRHSNQLWKQFKSAMDHFYDRRREYFKESKERQKENLKEKEEILEQLRTLGEHEDPIVAVKEAKPLQAKFKDVGYVPIKKKNEMWRQYREACDVIYERMRAAKSGDKFDRELAKASLDHEQRAEIQKLRKKHKKVEKEVEKLKKDVLQYQESKSYFTSTDEDNPLLLEMQQKIDKAENKLSEKQEELAELDKKIDMMKAGQ